MDIMGPSDVGGYCPDGTCVVDESQPNEMQCCCGSPHCCWSECLWENPPDSCLEGLTFDAEWRQKDDCSSPIAGVNSNYSGCFHAVQLHLGEFVPERMRGSKSETLSVFSFRFSGTKKGGLVLLGPL